MFYCNPSRSMNESLACYVSTNTFDNPIFDSTTISSSNFYEEYDEPKRDKRKKIEGKENKISDGEMAKVKELNFGKKLAEISREKCKSFYENLILTIRSKIYIIELNFKKKLRCLNNFATTTIPSILFNHERIGSMARETRRQRRRMEFYHNIWDDFEYNCESIFSQQEQANNYCNYDCYEGIDQFWNDIQYPVTRKSLGKQQEKILSRLEPIIQAKRAENNQRQLMERIREEQESASGDGSLRNRAKKTGESLLVDQDDYAEIATSISRKFGSSCIRDIENLDDGFTKGPDSMQNKVKGIKADAGKTYSCSNASIKSLNGNPGESKLCIVCYTNQANIVTLPCKHHEICTDCFIEIIYLSVKRSQFPLKCVLCRQRVEKVQCSKKLLLKVIETDGILA